MNEVVRQGRKHNTSEQERKPATYLMNEGYQHLLEITAPAGQKSINRLAIFAHMDWKVVTRQHTSLRRERRGKEGSIPILMVNSS